MIEFGPVRGGDFRRSHRRASATVPASPCRDLVAVSPAKPRERALPMPGMRSSTAFLAHLIATADGLPQTREKRRLAPEEASRLYAEQARREPRCSRLGSL